MKHLLMAIVFFGGLFGAMAEEKPVWTRTLTQFGVLATTADPSDLSKTGWGLSIRPYWYLDPSKPDGLYLGCLSGTLAHSASGTILADTRLVSLGWRGNPLNFGGNAPWDLQADFSLSPTLGQRISGNTILGGTYAGVGMTLGIYFPVLDWGDLGFSWEPTLNLSTFGGPDIPEKSYMDFVVYWTVKTYSKTTTLPWK